MDLEGLRLAVYVGFRETGRAAEVAELAALLEADETTVRRSLRELADQRHLVLGDDDKILMAHPFSAVPLGFSVMGTKTLWWGGCCWDSFALGHLLTDEPRVLVATTCPGCGKPGAWTVDRDAAPTGDWLAHFLVPVAHMWDDVVQTCANQRLFCSAECIDAWLTREDHEQGYVMDLETLWCLARHWYDGRFDRGYVRREPSEAREYMQSVGLRGPFWGS